MEQCIGPPSTGTVIAKYLDRGAYVETGTRVYAIADLTRLWVQLDGYEQVLGNLKKHASGWPEPDYLRSIVKAGTAQYGIEAVAEGNSTDASRLIEAAILKDDPRKLYLVANAGTNSLAQALVDLDTSRSKEQMDALCKKLVVFENGAQDNSGAWIANKYPEIAWHRSNKQTYCYGGPGGGQKVGGPYTWEPFPRTAVGQGGWSHEHIQTGHGALGGLFPDRIMRNCVSLPLRA